MHEAFTTTSIKASSRASIKIRDSYYTFEATEERAVNPDLLPKEAGEREKVISGEKANLWDSVNAEVDNQIQEIMNYLKQK
jgi:hypothetical protein